MSANSGLLLSTSGLFNVASVYYSPIATIPTTGVALSKIYCILSQVKPWPNDNAPPTPAEDQKYIKSVFKNNKAIYTKGGILLYLSIDSESRLLKKFDFISFTKVPGLIRNDGNPGEFNQKRYWLSQQITHRLFLGKKDWHKQIPFIDLIIQGYLFYS